MHPFRLVESLKVIQYSSQTIPKRSCIFLKSDEHPIGQSLSTVRKSLIEERQIEKGCRRRVRLESHQAAVFPPRASREHFQKVLIRTLTRSGFGKLPGGPLAQPIRQHPERQKTFEPLST